MLTNDIKRKIDSARDILVGKVPDPKAQVEQITTALIYKFMDDMDKESMSLPKGKPQFFTDGFEKYAWNKLMDPRLGGHERLNLYVEAITRLSQNPRLPQLFRDIFKGAFLPYRDPETLNLFLKEINSFTYDHSENLGNAYEYLLSILGSQGEAGQFRTPRHVIDFIVAVVDPKKDETILDPACGTAGFLISAYKHILAANQDQPLTPDEKKRLMANLAGYDISPDMVKLSLVNMYLHGFPRPHIYEYDTLTSQERWEDRFDVIMANPPFMTPKGGIRPHRRFMVQAKRSEVLFVDYIIEHLNPNGRAGLIVPEGIIFQSGKAYKQLRQLLIGDGLYAVVSLPPGVFKPYSGVKTSILFFDNDLAKRAQDILFIKITQEGYDLGDQRRPLCTDTDNPAMCPDHSDFPAALDLLRQYQQSLRQGTDLQSNLDDHLALLVPKVKINQSGDYNLSADRYREIQSYANQKWPMVTLNDRNTFLIESGGTPDSKNPNYWNGDVRWATLVDLPANSFVSEIYDTRRKITEEGLRHSSAKLLPKDSIIVSSRATIGRIAINKVELATNQGFKNIIINDFTKVVPKFVAYMMTKLVDRMIDLASGGTFKEISKTNFSNFAIPLPPLEIQKQIVAELDSYQKIIDGARQVIDNYRPTIKIDPDWELVPLGDILRLSSGKGLTRKSMKTGPYPVYGGNGKTGTHNEYFIEDPILVIGRVGAYCGAIHISEPKAWVTDNGLYVTQYLRPINQQYLAQILKQMNLNQYAKVGGQPSISQSTLYHLNIPSPPLEVQKQIVTQIQAEQELVDANKKLIEIYQAKIKTKLAEVWGE